MWLQLGAHFQGKEHIRDCDDKRMLGLTAGTNLVSMDLRRENKLGTRHSHGYNSHVSLGLSDVGEVQSDRSLL